MDSDTLNTLDGVVYEIALDSENKKWIHILGYGYMADDVQEDDKAYRIVEYCFCMVELKEFVAMTREEIWEMENESKQYIVDCDKAAIEEMYGGLDELPFEALTVDTPCGKYIDM